MSRDDAGYADIEQYAVIGDCRSTALVADDGRIDWWPVVEPDRAPAFAAILDPDAGGFIELRPTSSYDVSRRYLPDTNVLETTFTTETGTVQVLDLLPFGRNGNLAWSELIRSVEGVTGSVEMQWAVEPGRSWGERAPTFVVDRGTHVIELGEESLAIRAYDVGDARRVGDAICGRFRTNPRSRGLLAVIGTHRDPLFLVEREELEGHIDLTVDRWHGWYGSMVYDGRWRDTVRRSGLALKLLISIQTGAILAASTTSLPERIGGDKNWDYRFMWVRDSSFTIDALLSLGLHAEAQAAVRWLLDAVRRTAPDLRPFYQLSGDLPEPELILPLPGYRRSRPVRSGNGAADQLQLGNFGDLFDTIARYVDDGHRLDPTNAELLADLADRCCRVWMLPDCGIWELPDKQHYTISKVGCWAALDRSVQLSEQGQLPDDHVNRWREVRDEIRSWVDANCWSERRQAYTWYAGTDDLDAATLLIGRHGFDTGERFASTVSAIRAELAVGPCVYRYSGVEQEEGAFLACTFWLVLALVELREFGAAAELMDDAVGLTTDLGLMAEQIDPDSRSMLGNFPQGLSHLALINAACAYQKATDGSPDP